MSRKGLPGQVVMRRAPHFVEELSNRDDTRVGRMIPLTEIRPDPNQPRSSIGELSELTASILQKGVLEPILVRPDESLERGSTNFVIISGERRFRAGQEAGLYDIPAIVMEVDDQEALEIALVENLQREDLSSFEEAGGYRVLAEIHGYTHQEVATAVGKSRSTITESLSLLQMPEEVRRRVESLGIDSKSLLIELLKLGDVDDMLALLQKVDSLGLGRDAVRREARRIKSRGRPRAPGTRAKPYTFQFRAPDKKYRLSLSFRQSTVEPEDLIEALEFTLAELREQLSNDQRRDSFLT